MRHLLVSVLLLFALSTCGHGDSADGLNETNARHIWAKQLCEQASACDCEAGTDVDACDEANADLVAQWEQISRQQYLEFDADCMQRYLDRVAESGCDPIPDSGGDCDGCSFWTGGVAEGDAWTESRIWAKARCARA